MKLDIKSIALIVLLGLAVLFGSLWYFKGNDGSKERIKDLEQQAKQLEKQKREVDLVITSLQNTQLDLEKTIIKQTAQIAEMDKANAILANQSKEAKLNLAEAMKKLKETQAKIDELNKNPIKREGDDLLNSLKGNIK